MTNFYLIDATRLRGAMQALLEVLVDAAEGAGWEPSEACITPVEPGINCDSIHVWPQTIRPERPSGATADKCHVLPVVDLRFSIASCFGSDYVASCEWWSAEQRTPAILDRLWGVVGGLYVATSDGTLRAGMGVTCEDVSLGRVDGFDSGDMFQVQGTVSVTLGVDQIG